MTNLFNLFERFQDEQDNMLNFNNKITDTIVHLLQKTGTIVIPEDEQKAIREMMKKHYSHSLLDKVWDRRSNSIHMWTMLILGAALLSLYVFLTVIEQDTVALEILGTIGSFSIWEAADCFLVERLSIRKQMRYVSQNLVQEIEFHSETDLPQ